MTGIKEPKELQADGEWQDSDSFETNPEFQDLYEDMTQDFFEKEDPEYAAILKQCRAKDADEEPIKED